MQSEPNNIRRVIFKAPGMLFFRRCFLVKKVSSEPGPQGEERMVIKHGLRGTKVTSFPLKGSIVRLIVWADHV